MPISIVFSCPLNKSTNLKAWYTSKYAQEVDIWLGKKVAQIDGEKSQKFTILLTLMLRSICPQMCLWAIFECLHSLFLYPFLRLCCRALDILTSTYLFGISSQLAIVVLFNLFGKEGFRSLLSSFHLFDFNFGVEEIELPLPKGKSSRNINLIPSCIQGCATKAWFFVIQILAKGKF